MPHFQRVKTIAEISEQCHQQQLVLDTRQFRFGGYITVGGRKDGSDKGAYANFNPWHGRFFGKTDQGQEFDSEDMTCEGEPWFHALKAFFLTNDNAPAAKART